MKDANITEEDRDVVIIDYKDDSNDDNDGTDMVLPKLMTSESYNSSDIKDKDDVILDDENPYNEDPLEGLIEADEIGHIENEAHSEPESPLGRRRGEIIPTTSYIPQMRGKSYQ